MPSEREAGASSLIPRRFCELSAAAKILVSTMRRFQFGRFEDLRVQDGEPVFSPVPRLVRVAKAFSPRRWIAIVECSTVDGRLWRELYDGWLARRLGPSWRSALRLRKCL